MTNHRVQLNDVRQFIRIEYEEFPNLQLTQSQVEELWELDATAAAEVLRDLVSAGILKKTPEGVYVSTSFHHRQTPTI